MTCDRCFDPATTLICCETHQLPLCDRHQARHDHPSAHVRPVRVSCTERGAA